MNPEELRDRIIEAQEVLKGVAHRTPLSHSMTFSRMSGGDVYLKLENLQRTGAFKIRGAYYAIWRALRECEVSRCVTASSGNHGQGVALASRLLGVESTVVMPVHTPFYKVQAVRNYGAKVVLHGDTYDDAYAKALEIAEGENAFFVHPFDHLDVIAGQGTIGLEIVEDLPDVDVVVVPVGGGGLISGIAAAIKYVSKKKDVKIVGVQPEGCPSLYLSYRRGEPVLFEKPQTIADGVIVKRPGKLTFKLVRELVDDMVLVDDYEIARAIFLLLERAKLVAEPAGALSVAAVLAGKVDVKGKRVVSVISGGNIEMSLLSRIIERGLYLEGRQAKIRGVLPDKPGQLKKVVDLIAEYNMNITHIEHERSNPLVNPGFAEVTINIEIPDVESVEKLLSKLKAVGLEFRLVSPHE